MDSALKAFITHSFYKALYFITYESQYWVAMSKWPV